MAVNNSDGVVKEMPSNDKGVTDGNKSHHEMLERYQTASSVVIPREVFESMYLAPYTRTHGHLRSTFANPTPMLVSNIIV